MPVCQNFGPSGSPICRFTGTLAETRKPITPLRSLAVLKPSTAVHEHCSTKCDRGVILRWDYSIGGMCHPSFWDSARRFTAGWCHDAGLQKNFHLIRITAVTCRRSIALKAPSSKRPGCHCQCRASLRLSFLVA